MRPIPACVPVIALFFFACDGQSSARDSTPSWADGGSARDAGRHPDSAASADQSFADGRRSDALPRDGFIDGSTLPPCNTPGKVCAADGWCWEHPNAFGDLNAVTQYGATGAIAVGNHGAIVAFDGSTWARTPSPVSVDLYDVWSDGAQLAVAVGAEGTMLIFNGTNWRVRTTPTRDALQAVWGLSSQKIYLGAANGRVWRDDGVTFADLGAGQAHLSDLWVSPGGEVYVVGDDRGSRYDGTHWQDLGLPAVKQTYHKYGQDWTQPYAYNGIWGRSDKEVYVVDGSVVGSYPGLSVRSHLFTFDGVGWKDATSYTGAHFRQVTGDASGAVYIAARAESGILHVPSTGLFRYTSSGLAQLGSLKADIAGVTPYGSAGLIGAGPVGTLVRFDGQSWHVDGNPAPPTDSYDRIVRIWGAADRVYAVTAAGHLLVRTPSASWRQVTTPGAGSIKTIWGTSPDDVFFADDSAVRHFDGQRYATTSPPLRATWIAGYRQGPVYARSDAGGVFRYDRAQKAWQELAAPLDANGQPMTAGNEARLLPPQGVQLIASSNSLLLSFDGQSWSTAVNASGITRLWQFGAASYALGSAGLLRYLGGNWVPLGSPSGHIQTLWSDGVDQLFVPLAAGSEMQLWELGRGGWGRVYGAPVGYDNVLWGQADTLFVGGDYGTILSRCLR